MGAEHSSPSAATNPYDNEAGPSRPRPPPLPLGQEDVLSGLQTSRSTPTAKTSSASSSRRQPTPLNLSAGLPTPMGMDEELAAQRTADGTIFSPIVIVSESGDGKHRWYARGGRGLCPESDTMSERLHELSNLRSTVQCNLLARPIASASTGPSQGHSPARSCRSPGSIPGLAVSSHATLSIDGVLSLLESASQTVVVDVRPLGSYLASHLKHSVNLSIPTLIFKRLRKPGGAKLSWDTLDNFISTPEGKEIWRKLDKTQTIEVILIGEGSLRADDDVCSVLKDAMASLVGKDHVHVLHGGFDAVQSSQAAVSYLIGPEYSRPAAPPAHPESTSLAPPTSLFRPKTAPVPEDPRHFAPPPPMPSSPMPQRSLSHQASMPFMRQGIAAKRNLPSLQVQTGSTPKGPHLAVNVQPAVKSAYSGAFPQATAGSGFLHPDAARLDAAAPKTPLSGSFQALCLAQSRQRTPGVDAEAGSYSASGATARPFVASPFEDGSASGHGRYSGFGGHAASNGQSTARNGTGPFIVSTILPNFLYLGPEITSESEVQALRNLGVERILNVAAECNDDAGLDLRNRFDRYVRLPLRDIIEESGMAKGMRDACDFIGKSPFLARFRVSVVFVVCCSMAGDCPVRVLRGWYRVAEIATVRLWPRVITGCGALVRGKRCVIGHRARVTLPCSLAAQIHTRNFTEPMPGFPSVLPFTDRSIDDARLHSSPTYVHCRAGKSRSATVVLAYLIHANAWTLKTSYAYVAERRKGISPNIGFVAELMEFEEAELGLKQSSGVHGGDDAGGGSGSGGSAASA